MSRFVMLGVMLALATGLIAVVAASEPVRVVENPVDPDSLYDPIVGGEDFPGGVHWIVSRDGIRPVYEPAFVTAKEAAWNDDDLVIGVEIDGKAKAYPVGLLGAREMVNDWIGDVPILVSWCPLCGTGAVHKRTIDHRPVLFGNQGALWGNAMTWWDHDTGSIWSQPLGLAIAGPHEGRSLDLLPSTLTTWAAWRQANPATVALDGPVYWPGTLLENLAIVVILGDTATAYPIASLAETEVVNENQGGHPMAIVSVDGDTWEVFSRSVDGETVALSVEGEDLLDERTRSTWDRSTGRALSGPLEGKALQRLPSLTAFPEDFFTFWPDGHLWANS